MNLKKSAIWIILALALTLRLINLTGPDVITDESLIAIRSIGMIDYLASPYQTTPWEWYDPDIPAWAHLSMHDHPPLVFLIEFFSFKIFGVNLLGLRLPFVLFGVSAVFLIYLIGKELFSKNIGLLAAMLLAINDYTVWISRIGLQEAVVIFLSLLTIYFFVRALKNDKFFLLAGLSFGLGLLTKYTIIYVGLTILIYLVIFRRELFKNKKIYLGALVSLVLFLPVIIYNIAMYRATGHFDLQLAYLFGQKIPDWQNLMGKPTGNLITRFQNIFLNLKSVFSPIMFFGSAAAILLMTIRWIKNKFSANLTLIFLLLITYGLLLIAIGPAIRFLVILAPFIILIDAVAARELFRLKNNFFRFAVVGILFFVCAYEIFFSYNSFISSRPIGPAGLAYAKPLRLDSNWWGFNLLDNYLTKILAGKKPALSIPTKYIFLEKIRERAFEQNQGKEELAALIIYDGDIYGLAALWIFFRRMIYEGWPVVTADNYLDKGKDFFTSSGIKQFYFFQGTDNILRRESGEQTGGALKLAQVLREADLKPDSLVNQNQQTFFYIFKF